MTSLVSALGALLSKVVTHRELGTSIALFRVLLAATELVNLWLLSNEQVFQAIWFPRADGGLTNPTAHHWLYALLGGFSAQSVTTLYHLCWVGAGLTLVGFGGGISLLLCQQSHVALRSLNENASGGYDSLIAVGLLLLALARPTVTLSLDCWLLRRKWTSAILVSAWPRALIVFQLLFMYTVTGVQKVGHSWTPFGGYTAMHYVLNDSTWLRTDLGALPWLFDIPARIATFVTWHWEQLSFLLFFHWYYRYGNTASSHWFGRTFRRFDLRVPWALTGLFMHLGILALLDVGPFSLVSLSYYVCLWGPKTHQRHAARFTAWLARVKRTLA